MKYVPQTQRVLPAAVFEKSVVKANVPSSAISVEYKTLPVFHADPTEILAFPETKFFDGIYPEIKVVSVLMVVKL